MRTCKKCGFISGSGYIEKQICYKCRKKKVKQ